jgi:hypothetical protein
VCWIKADELLSSGIQPASTPRIISVDGIHMDPTKVAAVKEWTYPKDKKLLQVFLGFANFYRRFIQTFSYLTFPLTYLLLKDAKID